MPVSGMAREKRPKKERALLSSEVSEPAWERKSLSFSRLSTQTRLLRYSSFFRMPQDTRQLSADT